ncbi:hypothetical protein P389DRAFT_213351 [Cystobasidium minutum MCA 4210]|uniref:uncharacterized protein n=1 Tax=Cystobasidium minutum MCA 4210 TaxID=1397322 RepID=UPI0034CD1994|eukprot:jgi/Rhomi1/213351/estExt_Genemark1.C_110037
MFDKQEKEPPFFLKKEFWTIRGGVWRAPPYAGPQESHRVHYTGLAFGKPQARTWEPECHVLAAEPKKAVSVEQWQQNAWSWVPTLPSEPLEAQLKPLPASGPEPEAEPGDTPARAHADEPCPDTVPEPDPEPQSEPATAAEEPFAGQPPEPETLQIYYRRSFDALNGDFSPYSPHTITLGNKTFRTAAHLYWYIAFFQHKEVLAEMDKIGEVADHDDNLAHLLRIALHFRSMLQDNLAAPQDSRIDIMHAVNALKLSQHEAVLEALLATDERPLCYAQTPTSGISQNVHLLDNLAATLFPGRTEFSRFGEMGQPLPPNWVALLHPDDTFWGGDSNGNAESIESNHLGRILMDLRDGFRKNRAAIMELCKATASMLTAAHQDRLDAQDGHEQNESAERATAAASGSTDNDMHETLFNPEPYIRSIDPGEQL